MTRAYDPIYLDQAMRTMGSMLDTAVLDWQMDLSAFYGLFLATGIADRFASGEANLLAGKSGYELASLVLAEAYGEYQAISVQYNQTKRLNRFDRSPEYRTGWALSYYQWESGLHFSQIQTLVPITEIRSLYMPFHEMDIRQFSDKMSRLCQERQNETRLKRLRTYANLTQKGLAEKTGIPIRTIQQYEQRQKDINRASGQYLLQFASALNCRMEDLMEEEAAPPN